MSGHGTGGPDILVACIGNIFLGDDGFGVEVARHAAGMGLGPEVKLVDYGIRGLDLAYELLKPWRAVILVDAIARGAAAGSLYLLQPAGESGAASGLDPHAMDPARVIASARAMGEVTAEIYIVGCEPETLGDEDFGGELGGRMGLSAAVEAQIPAAVRMIRELVERLSLAAAES